MRYRFIVGGMLERVKQYPERALQRAKGVATVGFVLDRSGGVASVVLLRSSGEADLDAEVRPWSTAPLHSRRRRPARNDPLRSKLPSAGDIEFSPYTGYRHSKEMIQPNRGIWATDQIHNKRREQACSPI